MSSSRPKAKKASNWPAILSKSPAKKLPPKTTASSYISTDFLCRGQNCFNISYMYPQSESSGGRSHKTLLIVVLILLLIASLGFGGWSYSKMLNYKNNSDKISAAAVTAAQKQ